MTKDLWVKKEELQKITASNTGGLLGDAFSTIMNSYVEDVFADQAKDTELATFSEVKDVTPAFRVLGQQIQVIKKDILGGKDKEGSLLESL